MGFLRILGGVIVGVGAVAAAPFTGGGSVLAATTLAGSLAGAGTVAAAVGAGALGAVAANTTGKAHDDKLKNEGRYEGEEKSRAECSIKIEKLLKKIDDQKQLEKTIFAMVAVGMSCAKSDGYISKIEKEEITEFCFGLSQKGFSDSIQKKIDELIEDPVNIKEAYKLAESLNLGEDGWGAFDEIVLLAIDADGKTHEKERKFLNSWRRLRENSANLIN